MPKATFSLLAATFALVVVARPPEIKGIVPTTTSQIGVNLVD
jgi:hypothetical protein